MGDWPCLAVMMMSVESRAPRALQRARPSRRSRRRRIRFRRAVDGVGVPAAVEIAAGHAHSDFSISFSPDADGLEIHAEDGGHRAPDCRCASCRRFR